MPLHLRNGRDLSGEQRRRLVESGLADFTGQRTFQRVKGQPPLLQPGPEERPGSEPRSSPDTCQLQSHLSSVGVGNVDPVPLPVDRLTVLRQKQRCRRT
ncbi:hypothetical protein H4Q26_002330 [Puccinia striiformis f. sp. tritici PST-130]|nr:hypothetical protein H4Q26_002330 [Puccinia striiformis f. sp. tritici PST-130]